MPRRALPVPASPRPPCLALTSHTVPRPAMPCLPCPASPCRALPRLTPPCLPNLAITRQSTPGPA
nr:MAG TPA: hypothetical protein [Caudoviricetes sp.]